MRKWKRKGENPAQLGGIEVYPVGELDATGEPQALYKADGQHDGRIHQSPVEMSAYERPRERE
jgi:hypothetical protein